MKKLKKFSLVRFQDYSIQTLIKLLLVPKSASYIAQYLFPWSVPEIQANVLPRETYLLRILANLGLEAFLSNFSLFLRVFSSSSIPSEFCDRKPLMKPEAL